MSLATWVLVLISAGTLCSTSAILSSTKPVCALTLALLLLRSL